MNNEELSALYQLGGALGIVLAGVAMAIPYVLNKLKAINASSSPHVKETTVITTDTVAMKDLAVTIEASNVILTENNVLRREEHKDREDNRNSLDANTRALETNTKAVEKIADTIDAARAEVRELTREIVRNGRG